MDAEKLIPSYYIEDIYRYVKLYHHTYKCFTKARWVGMKIIDMFTDEFQAYDYEYYKNAILEGRIKVNKKLVPLDYKLKANDAIDHDATRIEPPIYNTEVEVIFEDNQFVVVNKPPSIPVHVSGGYMFNTVVKLMKFVYNYPDIYTVHRLDKLTSGLLIMTKSQDLAYKFQEDMKKQEVAKVYIARVYGDFPCKEGEELVVDKSIYCLSAKLGKYDFCKTEEEEKQGKTAKTVFKKIWYDPVSNSSLIEARLFTGRTHQVRVHCLSVGCSIINDMNYGGVFVGNPLEDIIRKKQGIPKPVENNTDAQTEQKPAEKPKEEKEEKQEATAEEFEPELKKKVKPDPYKNDKKVEVEEEQKVEEQKVEEQKVEPVGGEKKPEEKAVEAKAGLGDVNEEDQTYVMEIWLHSWKYQYKDKNFEAPQPYWANKDVKFDIQEFKHSAGWSHK